jgi:hypothetical protein
MHMNIIRDEEFSGTAMLPLLIQWGIKRCNVKDCTHDPSTIIAGVPDVPVLGMCEDHYQQAKEKGKFSYKLEF